jgi:hypothetical protein
MLSNVAVPKIGPDISITILSSSDVPIVNPLYTGVTIPSCTEE